MKIGYARVSANDQDTQGQIGKLKDAGCELIFEEQASGGRWDRPELHRLLSHLRKGDVLIVWKLDRLSRSLRDVLFLMEKVEAAWVPSNKKWNGSENALPAKSGLSDRSINNRKTVSPGRVCPNFCNNENRSQIGESSMKSFTLRSNFRH